MIMMMLIRKLIDKLVKRPSGRPSLLLKRAKNLRFLKSCSIACMKEYLYLKIAC